MFADAGEKVSEKNESSNTTGTQKNVRRVRELRSLIRSQVSLDSLYFLNLFLFVFLKCDTVRFA